MATEIPPTMAAPSPIPGAADPLAGKVLGERWQITSKLAEGGMGLIYRALDQTLGVEVAVKLLRNEALREPGMLTRFLDEARCAARIESRHTVRILDWGEMEDHTGFYLVMELVRGESLHALLQKERFSIRRSLPIAIQIARALSAAHRARIIHRDLKPANVMLTDYPDETDFVTVVDFGIAKNDGDDALGTTRTNLAMGTAGNMAPEQGLNAKNVDYRADIYSLGCILYEMLTGVEVFEGDSYIAVINAHCRDPVTPPSQRAPDRGITTSLDAIVIKMLAKKPEDRYQSMVEVIEALRGVELPIELTPVRSPLVGSSGASPDTFTLDVSVEGLRAPSRIELAPRRTTGGKRRPTTGGSGRRKTPPRSSSRSTPPSISRPKPDDELMVWARKAVKPAIWLIVIWITWHFGAKYWETIGKPLAPLIGAAKSKING